MDYLKKQLLTTLNVDLILQVSGTGTPMMSTVCNQG